MKYWVGTGGGTYAQPFSQKENAETEARELSLSEENTWFQVEDDSGHVISVWRDGEGYYPPQHPDEYDLEGDIFIEEDYLR